MAIFYGIGTHRIIYRARNFATGLTVTAYLWSPTLVKSALQTFTEVSDGLYYLDYAFAAEGVYFGKFYEGGVGATSGNYSIVTMVTDILDEAMAGHDVAGTLGSFITAIKKIKTNRWKINTTTKQLIYYDDDGITALYTFSLLDSNGLPTTITPAERVPV